jgi:integrase
MNAMQPIDQTKILTRQEIVTILADLTRKGKRSANSRMNKVIFRLATCCGLRVSEICGLSLANAITGSKRPHLHLPAAIAKRHKARKVPLWWDAATLADLEAWKRERIQQGAKPGSPFICSQARGRHSQTGQETFGKRLAPRNAQARFKKVLKVLGIERVRMLSIHCGRHSFCSHALAGGRSLAEVRDAAGHANIATTSIYLHAVSDDDDAVGNLFDFSK